MFEKSIRELMGIKYTGPKRRQDTGLALGLADSACRYHLGPHPPIMVFLMARQLRQTRGIMSWTSGAKGSGSGNGSGTGTGTENGTGTESGTGTKAPGNIAARFM